MHSAHLSAKGVAQELVVAVAGRAQRVALRNKFRSVAVTAAGLASSHTTAREQLREMAAAAGECAARRAETHCTMHRVSLHAAQAAQARLLGRHHKLLAAIMAAKVAQARSRKRRRERVVLSATSALLEEQQRLRNELEKARARRAHLPGGPTIPARDVILSIMREQGRAQRGPRGAPSQTQVSGLQPSADEGSQPSRAAAHRAPREEGAPAPRLLTCM